jgi:hypothetical protein
LLALFLALPAAQAREKPSYQANSGAMRMGGILLLQNTEAPLSFVSLTRGELPSDAVDIGPVYGKGCQHGLSIPLSASLRPTRISGAAGRGGTHKALAKIREKHGEFRGLYDVMVDIHMTAILGLYRRQCVEINARAFR